MKKRSFIFFFLLLPFSCSFADIVELLIPNARGEMYVIEIDEEETIATLQKEIESFQTLSEEEQLEYCPSATFFSEAEFEEYDLLNIRCTKKRESQLGAFAKSSSAPINRDYTVPLTKRNKEDITFIIETLSNKSIPGILMQKSSLDDAGDRIESIHPLNFLRFVFTEEKLKAHIRNVKSRGWIWGDFIKGLSKSLEDETQKNNMPQEYIKEFASDVNIDLSIILPSIRERNWKGFVDLLIKHVPREGDPGRYDF